MTMLCRSVPFCGRSLKARLLCLGLRSDSIIIRCRTFQTRALHHCVQSRLLHSWLHYACPIRRSIAVHNSIGTAL